MRALLAVLIGCGMGTAHASSLVGIGAALDVNPDQTVVIRHVFTNSPAAKAGLQVGDVITTVQQTDSAEPVSVYGKNLDDIVALIRGPDQSRVTLGIMKASGETEAVDVVRDSPPPVPKPHH